MSKVIDDYPQGNFLRAALEEAEVEPSALEDSYKEFLQREPLLSEESIKKTLDAEVRIMELMYTEEEWDELTKGQPGGQVGSTVYLDKETLF